LFGINDVVLASSRSVLQQQNLLLKIDIWLIMTAISELVRASYA